jgi:hypothetical protein
MAYKVINEGTLISTTRINDHTVIEARLGVVLEYSGGRQYTGNGINKISTYKWGVTHNPFPLPPEAWRELITNGTISKLAGL